jgi:hypothetical protein
MANINDPELEALYKKLSVLENMASGLPPAVTNHSSADKQINTRQPKPSKEQIIDPKLLLNLGKNLPNNKDLTLGEYLQSQAKRVNMESSKLAKKKPQEAKEEDEIAALISKVFDKTGFGIVEKKNKKQVKEPFISQKDNLKDSVINPGASKRRKEQPLVRIDKSYANTSMKLTSDMKFAPLNLQHLSSR